MESEKKDAVARLIKCPRCRKPTKFHPSNEWRPFCSERCKTNDIAAWASDEYRIAWRPVNEEELTQEMLKKKKGEPDEE